MKSMQHFFEKITDPRQQGKIQHNLVEIIVMTIVSVVARLEHWNEIVMYCQVKQDWFREKLGLKLTNGIPSEDTFARIFALINPKELENCFIQWVNHMHKSSQGDIISIDGKTLKGSRKDAEGSIHMVSAWSNNAQLVIGQLRVKEKSNEITAMPDLLDLLEINGGIITSDAMGCQKKIVEKIASKECDYAICLKGNQAMLHEEVKLYLDTAVKQTVNFPTQQTETLEKDHGRIEERHYYLTEDVDWIEGREEWEKLNAIGMVESVRIIKGKKTRERRYFITSLTDVKTFAKAVRAHWGIENSLHWCLDMNFNEDRCRMRVNHSGENFAVMRHIATNLYKSYTDCKLSMKAKRCRCGFDDEFLQKVIFNHFAIMDNN